MYFAQRGISAPRSRGTALRTALQDGAARPISEQRSALDPGVHILHAPGPRLLYPPPRSPMPRRNSAARSGHNDSAARFEKGPHPALAFEISTPPWGISLWSSSVKGAALRGFVGLVLDIGSVERAAHSASGSLELLEEAELAGANRAMGDLGIPVECHVASNL